MQEDSKVKEFGSAAKAKSITPLSKLNTGTTFMQKGSRDHTYIICHAGRLMKRESDSLRYVVAEAEWGERLSKKKDGNQVCGKCFFFAYGHHLSF